MVGKINRICQWGWIMKTACAIAVITGVISSLLVPPIFAGGISNARAIGMAGAYSSLAQGYDCPLFNPANLGLETGKKNGLQIVGVGVTISNNSFSLDDYNNYTGATLDEADKTALLDKIPLDGLKVSADAEASVLAFGMGRLAFSVTGLGAAEISMSREVAELLLRGNTIADTIVLDGTYAEGFALASANLSYGYRLYKGGDRQLAAGITYRYLRGFAYEEILELDGQAATLATGFTGAGSVVSRTATGGTGHAVDLGASLQLSKNYTVGATMYNAVSTITWNRETQEHRYAFAFDTLTVGNMSHDEIVTSTDTTVDISNFSTSLPAVIRVGFARTSGSLLYAIDWEQGFRQAAASSKKPRLTGGAEWCGLGFLPLRAGIGIGGKRGLTFAAGFGLKIPLLYVDIAVANYNAISGSAGKGLSVAANLGIRI